MIPATPPNIPLTRRQTPRGYIRNDTAANMGKFHIRLQRLLNGDDTLLRINLFGDSLTHGSGGVLYRNSIGARLATLFRDLGFAVSDNKFGIASTAAATITYDPRYAITGTNDAYQPLPGGLSWRLKSSGAKLTYSPGVSFDTAVVKWFRDTSGNGGGGNMIITVDGGATNFTTPTSGGSVATQTISQSGAASIQDLVITIASAGVHTIEVTNDVTGNIEIFGFEYYTAATPTILIRTMGFSGYTSTNYVANNIPVRMYDTALTGDLSLFCLGDNDAFNGTALATYSANLATLKASLTALGTASILGWTWPPADVATYPAATQKSYVDAFIAAMGSNVLLCDLYQRYVDLGGQELLSITTGGYYKDTIHPSAFGNMDIAAFLFGAMMPMGV